MSQLYGINDPGMSEEDFLDMLEEFGRDCERWRFLNPQGLDENYGFRLTEVEGSILDSCDSLNGWQIEGEATPPVLDSINKREGLASISMGKNSGSTSTAAYYKVLGNDFDGAQKEVRVWVYISDVAKLRQIGTSIIVSIHDYTDANYYYREYSRNQLSNGWNILGGFFTEDFKTEGVPDIARLKKIRITFYTDNATDVIESGELKMDYWFLAFQEELVIDGCNIDSQEVFESFDSTAGWSTEYALAPTLDYVNKKEGFASMNVGTSNTTQNYMGYIKTYSTPLNGSDKSFGIWFYITDVTKLLHSSPTSDSIVIHLITGSGTDNYFVYYIDYGVLVNGWNFISFDIQSENFVGSPNISDIRAVRIRFFKDTPSTTIPLGSIKIDCLSVFNQIGWNSIYSFSPRYGLDTNDFVEGNSSLMLGSANTTINYTALYKTKFLSFDGTNKILYVWFYIDDTNRLLPGNSSISLIVGNGVISGSSVQPQKYKYFSSDSLSNGWNLLSFDIGSEGVIQNGTGIYSGEVWDITKIRSVRLNFYKKKVTDTIPFGAIKIDSLKIKNSVSNWSIDKQTFIITPVTERDAKLIEAGFANIGDFKVFAPYSYDIKAHDIVYDPVKNMYLELEEVPSIPVIQVTGVCKIFVGKVTNRPVPP